MAQLGLGAAALPLAGRACSRRGKSPSPRAGRHATRALRDLSRHCPMMHYDWQWKKRYVQILLNCTAKPDASSDHMEKPLLGAVLCCTAIPPEQRVSTGQTTAITRLCIDSS